VSNFNNITSILGMAYVLPEYIVKRGPKVTFDAFVFAGGKDHSFTVTGNKVVFDLVMHRRIRFEDSLSLSRYGEWVISEPITGCRVSYGRTRQDALDALAERVAYCGGEAKFRKQLDNAINNTLAANYS